MRAMKADSAMTYEHIRERVSKLRVGGWFPIETEQDRARALLVARVLGKRVTTRAKKGGGFTVVALP